MILTLLLAFLPLAELWAAMRRVSPGTFLMVLAAYLAAHTVATLKWRMMVNLAGTGLGYAAAARCYFAGLFGNVFLPSIVGGDVIRAGLAMRMGQSRAGAVLGSLLDRMLDVTALAALAAGGALLLPTALDEKARRVFWMLAVAAVGGAAFGLLLVWMTLRRKHSFRMRRRLAKLRRAWRAIARQPARVAAALVLAVIIQGSFVALNAWMGLECGLVAPLRVWLFAWPLAKLSAMLPATQAGIGVREAALAGLMLPFGVPAVLTVAVGLVWEVVLVAGGLIGGGLSLLVGRERNEPDAQLAGAADMRSKGPRSKGQTHLESETADGKHR